MVASARHHKVCVIGAGPCGLTAIKNLKQNGVEDIVCHEALDCIGGLWAFSSDPHRPSVYDSVHIITSRRMSGFRDFPMPEEYPDYPSRHQVITYFKLYAFYYKLNPYVRLNSRVDRAERRSGGGWSLTVSDENGTHEETADFLIVAAGHHRIPFTPSLAKDFDGLQIHSSEYRTPDKFEGKNVLVVGAGNSACDMASALSRLCPHVSLSMRSPQYILPKTLLGRPADIQFRKMQFLPRFAQKRVMRIAIRLLVGRYKNYGLPVPDSEVLASHPTMNSDILEQLTHGRVTIRSETKSVAGKFVDFSNGDRSKFDAIIWATGFKTQFPFLPDQQFDWSQSLRIPLYLKIVPPSINDMFFIGLIQPLGCLWRLADYQSELVAKAITNEWQRPSDLEKRLAEEHALDSAQYSNTARHAAQVNYHEYKQKLLHELQA